MKLNQQQKDLLIGTLLGDGHLASSTKGRTWRYRAIHKKKHQLYLFHKYEIFEPFCKSKPVYAEVFDSRTQKTYQRWSFNTITHICFEHYANLFYTNDTKTSRMSKDVPKNIKLYLTPAAIAYWYMDDGALKWLGQSNAMRICTESFSEGGVYRFKSALNDLFNIQTQLIRKTNQGSFVGPKALAINKKTQPLFVTLLSLM
jgi:recombination protein RecA